MDRNQKWNTTKNHKNKHIMNKILFIDILTTGTNPQKCGIYAIGGILCEDSVAKMKEIKKFEYRLRPFDGARIVDNSLWLGGVTRSHLLYYKKENEVLDAFMEMLSECIKLSNPEDKVFISGFNSAAFDMPFLKEWFERNGNKRFRDCFHMQPIDLLCMSAYALMSERHTMREFNLVSVSRKLGVISRTGETYSCIDNVETCVKIYRKLKDILKTGSYGEYEETDEIITNFTKK